MTARKRIRRGGLTGLLALSLFPYACGPRMGGAPEIGSEAPGFELNDLQGRRVTLDQHRGKIVMLDFWATWCGPCRTSMPLLERLQSEFHDAMVLLAINIQEPAEEVRAYVERRGIHSRVLLDEEGQVAMAYRSASIPMQVLIDQNGVIRHIQMGVYPTMERDLRDEIKKLLAD